MHTTAFYDADIQHYTKTAKFAARNFSHGNAQRDITYLAGGYWLALIKKQQRASNSLH